MRVFFDDVAGVRTRWYRSDHTDLPPALLVHGGGAAADTWIRNVDALGEQRLVVAPDLLGHGFTALPEGATDGVPQLTQAAQLWRLVDHLGWNELTLIGHSFGALIVALMTLERPRRVSDLVLVASSSAFHAPSGHAGSLSGARANQLPALQHPTAERIRARNVGSNYDRSDTFEEILAVQMTAMAMPGRLEAFEWTTGGLEASAHSLDARVHHRLDQLDLPTLVVAGRDDPRCDAAAVEAAVERMPRASLVMFDECGHKPHSEQTARFNQVVVEFLAGSRAAVPTISD